MLDTGAGPAPTRGGHVQVTAAQRRRQQKITAELSRIALALPGSVEVRRTECGKPNCRCHTGPESRHGPYNVWTRKVNARTVTKVLTDDELEDYRPLLDSSRRLRELVHELHQLTLQIVEADQARRRRTRRPRPRPKAS
jgi:hypothetical protein